MISRVSGQHHSARPPTIVRRSFRRNPASSRGWPLPPSRLVAAPLGRLADLPLTRAGNRQALAPKKNFGTAIGFVELKRKSGSMDVRFGSKADIPLLNCNVRFTP